MNELSISILAMGLRPSVKHEDEHHDVHPRINTPARNLNQGSTSEASSTSQREAWTARGQLLLNFHNVISRAINSPEMIRKCSDIAEDMKRSSEGSSIGNPSILPTVGRHSIAEEYSAEAALIVENKSKRDAVVMTKAMTVGLFSFVALRSGRGLSSLMRKSIANNRRFGAGVYQFDKIAASKSMLAGGGDTTKLNQPSKLRRFFGLTLDATISTSIAFLSGTFLFMPRPSAYIEDMSKLPLVEGKSVYAEMVCPPLLKEYRRVLMQYGGRWPVNSGSTSDNVRAGDHVMNASQLTQEDVSLGIIRTFVRNCYTRSLYEVSIRLDFLSASFSDSTSNTD